MNKHPMTKEGADALKEELNRLKKDERPRITEAIAEAREHGDLKENAEYHAAREQQGLVEARIKQIEGILSHSQVIDVTKLPDNGKVVFGATVTLLNLDTEDEVTYKIVGNEEADIKHNKVSVSSPMARALIGKEEGDEVQVQAPGGNIDYEIVEVQYI
ncbi:transcription elongation factor GreA [Thiomicrorhabdus xiamenensis]|uniref:Transcription elongation factor GreA n=1 Tax=Thiomicrorhabdus xiamenensis TaxID=2739063 RepID=A0A7D4SS21_9GAMM|nr:transcription elongation factor GreA [Thiomicrorhabdus xiamenensis]QKI88983.1 transcription elongation factor GreA [Thiomicrorhabdus xiamenensis]